MKRSHPVHLAAAALALGLLAAPVRAEPPGGPPGARPGGPPPAPQGPVEGSGTPARQRTLVGWYGTWDGALAESRRSGRPILLLSAAPHCHEISGVW